MSKTRIPVVIVNDIRINCNQVAIALVGRDKAGVILRLYYKRDPSFGYDFARKYEDEAVSLFQKIVEKSGLVTIDAHVAIDLSCFKNWGPEEVLDGRKIQPCIGFWSMTNPNDEPILIPYNTTEERDRILAMLDQEYTS